MFSGNSGCHKLLSLCLHIVHINMHTYTNLHATLKPLRHTHAHKHTYTPEAVKHAIGSPVAPAWPSVGLQPPPLAPLLSCIVCVCVRACVRSV